MSSKNFSNTEQFVQRKNYYPHFDWLRGALSLLVVLSHLSLVPHVVGGFAVFTFLTLSGFVVSTTLFKMKKKDIHEFFFSRALRIWLPYYSSVLLLILASVLHKDVITDKWIEFVVYKLTFVYNLFGVSQIKQFMADSPLHGAGDYVWSINLQEQFYLIVPFALLFSGKYLGRSSTFWFVTALIFYVLQQYGCTCIMLGVAFALYTKENNRLISLSLILVLLLVSCAGFLFTQLNHHYFMPIASIAAVVLLARTGEKNKLGVLFSGLSLQLYLNAWIGTVLINAIANKFGFEKGLIFKLVTVLASLCIAYILYLFIDLKLITNKKQIRSVINPAYLTWASFILVGSGLVFGLTR
jgi:peptidoglycan/LPS O-acetylase OafA/YrhL